MRSIQKNGFKEDIVYETWNSSLRKTGTQYIEFGQTDRNEKPMSIFLMPSEFIARSVT